MSVYTLKIGLALAEALERANTSQPEQFAGYFNNLSFWLDEFKHLVFLRDTYSIRLEVMQQGISRFLESGQRRYNIDDAGVPFQQAIDTSSKSDRNEVVNRCFLALDKTITRALKLGLIDFCIHDDLLDAIKDVVGKK